MDWKLWTKLLSTYPKYQIILSTLLKTLDVFYAIKVKISISFKMDAKYLTLSLILILAFRFCEHGAWLIKMILLEKKCLHKYHLFFRFFFIFYYADVSCATKCRISNIICPVWQFLSTRFFFGRVFLDSTKMPYFQTKVSTCLSSWSDTTH